MQARCFKDKSFVRWPPHINLLYPFHEDSGDAFAAAAETAAAACRSIQPFQVTAPLSAKLDCGRGWFLAKGRTRSDP